MKNIQKIVSRDISNLELDNHMNQLLREKFDKELGLRYSKVLNQEHNVTRKGGGENLRYGNYKFFVLILGLILTAVLITSKFFFFTNDIDYKQLVYNYDLENPFVSNRQTRNTTSADAEYRILGFQYFEGQQYDKCSESLKLLGLKNNEDNFYIGYSYFKLQEYAKAIPYFETVILTGEAYAPESKLYTILSLVASGNSDKAKVEMNKLKEDSWEFKQVGRILK